MYNSISEHTRTRRCLKPTSVIGTLGLRLATLDAARSSHITCGARMHTLGVYSPTHRLIIEPSPISYAACDLWMW